MTSNQSCKRVFPYSSSASLKEHALTPLISVVMPIYNQARFAKRGIESVLNQKGVCLELLIVNDGSTDDLETVLRAFESNPHVTIITQENRGIAAALNRGFAEAKGEFVTWTSADNILLPHALKRLAAFLEQNPEVDLTYANVRLISDKGKPLKESAYRKADQDLNNPSLLRLPNNEGTLLHSHDNFINACFLYRRRILQILSGFNSEHRGIEDFDYWQRLSMVGIVEHVDDEEPLYEYRLHEHSLTSTIAVTSLREKAYALTLENQKLLTAFKSASSTTSGNKAQRISPETKALRLLHTSHARFLKSGGFNFESTPGVFYEKEKRKIFIPPPLFLPPLLKRARSTNYHAVTAHRSYPLCVGVFVPDTFESNPWAQKCLLSLIEQKRVTVVLIAETSSQRKSADSINMSLKDNSNLRIIDLSTCYAFSDCYDKDPGESYEFSLLYTFSSLDCILSIKDDRPTADTLLESRIESGLAALSGIPHFVILSEEGKRYREEHQTSPWYADILASAHLNPSSFFITDKSIEKLPQNIREAQKSYIPSQSNQFINCLSVDYFEKTIVGLSML